MGGRGAVALTAALLACAVDCGGGSSGGGSAAADGGGSGGAGGSSGTGASSATGGSSGTGGGDACLAKEICNGLDDDCNGLVDDAPAFAQLGQTCVAGKGACAVTGTYQCAASGTAVECSATPLAPQAESCTPGEDRDCDGTTGCNDLDCTPCGACEICNATGTCDPKPAASACNAGTCVAGACVGATHTWDGGAALDLFGASVSLGPDADGDGRGDVLIGSPDADPSALSRAGRACLYSGASAALLHCWDGALADDRFGARVSLGPDVDGDGRGDVLVASTASVFLYSGATYALLQQWSPAGGATSAVLGPDVDGDGRGDVVAGAPFAHAPATGGGAAFLYSGQSGALIRELTGTGTNDRFGSSVSLGPDVDGDGRGDVLVSMATVGTSPGTALLYSGAAGTLLHTWTGENGGDSFGGAVSLGPDADGDARGDALVGAIGFAPGGRAYLQSGQSGALIHSWDGPSTAYEAYALFLCLGPDADGDGKGDVLVSATENAGSVYLYSGASGAPIHSWRGELGGDHFGAISLGPDADGDGLADVLVGASGVNGYTGRAYLFGSKNW